MPFCFKPPPPLSQFIQLINLSLLIFSLMPSRLAEQQDCTLRQLWTTQLLTLPSQLLTYLLTYLLTPWCRALLEKLTGLQLVKKFPTFHGTRRFITALTRVHHLPLSWASPIQSIYPHSTSWRSILILSTHLRLALPSGLFPSCCGGMYVFAYVTSATL